MKTIIKNIFITILISFSNIISAQHTTSTLQVFHTTETHELLEFSLGNNVKIHTTSGSRIMVETFVKAKVPNSKILQFFVDQKRYELVLEESLCKGKLKLKPAKKKNLLIIKGEICEEFIEYHIHVPQHLLVNQNTISMGPTP